MERPGHKFPPAMSFKQLIDHALMDFVAETAFQRPLYLCSRSYLTAESCLFE
jgi:hypothetical protein